MRGLLLCLAALFSLAPLTLAQTEAILPTNEITTEITSSPNAETPLPARIAPTDWQIRVPDSLSPNQDWQPQPAPLLMLHPKPITLNALTQHTPPHRFGFEFSIGGYQPSGELRNTNLIHTTVGIGFGLAIRPGASWSRLQFDAGTDLIIDGIGSRAKKKSRPVPFAA